MVHSVFSIEVAGRRVDAFFLNYTRPPAGWGPDPFHRIPMYCSHEYTQKNAFDFLRICICRKAITGISFAVFAAALFGRTNHSRLFASNLEVRFKSSKSGLLGHHTK